MENYFIGLDIGTDSVGWAATDSNYNVIKFHGKAMWGVHLFDESNTAEERRVFRASRRRLARRKERLNLLEMLFNDEISSIDPAFFQKLRESNLYPEDKTVKTPYSVFSDDKYNDIDYQNQYPTIYHLRKELLESTEEHDVRLVFLAIHHIIKYRGHFLFDSLDVDGIKDFNAVFEIMVNYINDNYLDDEDKKLSCTDTERLSEVLKNKRLSKTAKTAEIAALFGVTKKEKQRYSMLSLLSGATVKLSVLFDDDTLKDAEKASVSLSGKFADDEEKYESILGERFELISVIKAVYDWSLLADIMHNKQYVSQAKTKIYDEHKADLALLKNYIKTYCPGLYNEVFRSNEKSLKNYTAYSGHSKINGKKRSIEKRCTQQDFCDYLNKLLPQNSDEEYSEMFEKIKLGTFMPKQTTSDNSVIPMQLQLAELKKILENAEAYLPFLKSHDDTGLTVSEKIIKIFEYRIPYYVGPLNSHSDKAWLIRSGEKIYPWNFEKVVDTEKTAEEFIKNLTSKCTYLPKCDVIPKFSILYSKFCVLNELNNLKIDTQPISVELKQRIYEDLFLKQYKVRESTLKKYLRAVLHKDVEITGIDGDFKSSMKSYLDLSRYDISTDDMEEIIKAITIFGDDKRLLKKRLENQLGTKLNQEELKKICSLKYTGWSRLSKEFLTEIESAYMNTEKENAGEVMNIITAMWVTNDNLMQLLYSEDFDFLKKVSQYNKGENEKNLKKAVSELYVSPKVKRPIYRAMLIVKEIVKIMGYEPKKIFVEVAKGPTEDQKNNRTQSRKDSLVELYKSCKMQSSELYKSLLEKDDERLRSDKLYLYYTQMGRCMYTGERIDLELLMSDNSRYDIDHIYPRSKIKDDSLANRVLVNKTQNAGKTDIYPISKDIRDKMQPIWKNLLDKRFIPKEKYFRLTRNSRLTDEELSSFISRQIVETRQSTKAVAKLLEEMFDDKKTEVVYVKASLASQFRHDYDMLKCREVNDFHHAKDAYLNIVVGNVYNVRFTHDKKNFIAGLQDDGKDSISLNAIYAFDTPGAWKARGENNSLDIVKKTMRKNNILYTRYAFKQSGGLFDQNPLKKGLAQVPLKKDSPRSDIEKYGGYAKPTACYFSFVQYIDEKEKAVRAFIPIDLYREKEYKANPVKYLEENLQIKNVKVIIPCVKYNSCISIDGFRMHLSCKSSGGKTIVYKPAMQLVLGYKYEKYIRNISKYLAKYKNRPINAFDGLNAETNIELYDSLIEKMLKTILSRKFADIGSKIQNGREEFIKLSVENQCIVISEIIKILHANVMPGDLKLIGGAGKAGIVTTNNKISEIKNVKSIKLIDQSVTGLFEKETELLK